MLYILFSLFVVVAMLLRHYAYSSVKVFNGKRLILSRSQYQLCVASGFRTDSDILTLCDIISLRNHLVNYFVSEDFERYYTDDYICLIKKLRKVLND
jgi:hypothetical protein